MQSACLPNPYPKTGPLYKSGGDPIQQPWYHPWNVYLFLFFALKWLVDKLQYDVSFSPHCLTGSALSCEAPMDRLRKMTMTGRLCGDEAFIQRIEDEVNRTVGTRRRGRKPKKKSMMTISLNYSKNIWRLGLKLLLHLWEI